MASGSGGGGNWQDQVKAQEELQKRGFEQQMAMMRLQEQQNQRNTLVQALSSLEKGNSDTMKAIAQNMK